MILIDFREKQSKVPQILSEFGLEVLTDTLPVDYIIDGECFIERKTVSDFITSVVDGRLFRQVSYLSKYCGSSLVLLEGGGLYKQERMNASAIRGVLLWITMKKKVPLIRTYNEYDTACILRLLADQYKNIESTPKVPFEKLSFRSGNGLQKKRKIISINQQEINILTQIPGIGRQTAKDLLTACDSLANIVQAEDAVLMNVPCIGKERLASIRQLFPQQVKSRKESSVQE